MAVLTMPFGKIRIHVTKSDINKGCEYRVDSCAVARAVKRAFPQAKRVAVNGSEVVVSRRTNYNDWLALVPVNPRHHAKFISDFDSGKPVKRTSLTYTVRSVK